MSKSRHPGGDESEEREPDIPLVCNLPAPGRIARAIAVHAVIARATSFRELENGVSFAFRNEDALARSLLDLVLAERNCCAHFRYTLLFAPEHKPIELIVEGDGPLVGPLKTLYLGLARLSPTRFFKRR